ncbi:MAG: hybrid sensor histidine kinase/response regulator [Verrucomicrobiota bacterium]|nr:hybrid sensor histidine kinase/response regulator [Verrucomicrobiota bacterium]
MLESREQLMDRVKALGAQAMPGGGTATVLVVDDSATNRKSLSRLLGYAGHRVLQATNGVEALTLAQTERPDVVISDVLMPRMDGYEFARRVRANPSIAGMPIIFYSAGYNQEEARSLAQSCGVFHILSMPAKPEEMLRTINAALNEATSPAAAAAAENFDEAHRRLLTDKLSEKVAELEAALAKSRQNEVCLLQAMEKTIAAERALERSNTVLVRQNQEIQSFYHTVSHELKTPLTSVREFISIVLDGLAGPLDETQREYLNIAKESCNRLGVSINDLMDATRLETGKLTLELKPGSLDALVREVVTAMGPVAARKQISLRGEVQPDLALFTFDKIE